MDKKLFSDWLLEQMESKNLTQADLAKASGLTRTAISDYVNQKRTNPEPQALIAIAKALHVSPLNVFRAAGLLPDDHASDEEKFLRDWKELIDGLSKHDLDILKQMAVTLRNAKK